MNRIADRLLIGIYLLVLLAVALVLPIRVPEALQLAASHPAFSWRGFFGLVAQAPDSAPLGYLTQLPFTAILGTSALAARIVSVLSATGCAYAFLWLARHVPLRRPLLSLAVFMLFPNSFIFATDARPYGEASLFLLIASCLFLKLVRQPSVKLAVYYGLFLTLAIYTSWYVAFPAIGFVLFILRFASSAKERRALWFALPGTWAPFLLFAPYFAWAHPQANARWLSMPVQYQGEDNVSLFFASMAPGEWAGFTIAGLAILALIGGLLATILPRIVLPAMVPPAMQQKRITVFWILGGAVAALVVPSIVNAATAQRFAPWEFLPAAPFLVLSLFSFLDLLSQIYRLKAFAIAAATVVMAVCAVVDAQFLTSQKEDVKRVAAAVVPELTGDSCVVFVSQRFSKAIFLVFQPDLGNRECSNFFHRRIVLASHPYVLPDQQADAEGYFRGLNFLDKKRQRIGDGQIVDAEESLQHAH